MFETGVNFEDINETPKLGILGWLKLSNIDDASASELLINPLENAFDAKSY